METLLYSSTWELVLTALAGVIVVGYIIKRQRPSHSLAAMLERITSMAQPARIASQSPDNIDHAVAALFATAKEDRFEDGMESPFSRRLTALIEEAGSAAVEAIAHQLLPLSVNAEAAAEALRWMGNMEDPATYSTRLSLLENCLESPSPRVRDGAAIGLAAMDDPRSIASLKRAIERESLAELRQDMTDVLLQLENSPSCR